MVERISWATVSTLADPARPPSPAPPASASAVPKPKVRDVKEWTSENGQRSPYCEAHYHRTVRHAVPVSVPGWIACHKRLPSSNPGGVVYAQDFVGHSRSRVLYRDGAVARRGASARDISGDYPQRCGCSGPQHRRPRTHRGQLHVGEPDRACGLVGFWASD